MRGAALTNEDIERAVGYLSAHAIWSGLPPERLEDLAAAGEICLYEKGERIWGGEAGYRQALGLVLGGAAQVRKERMLLSVHREGDYFGLVTLFYDTGYYAAEIEALRECRVLFIGRLAVERLLDACPGAAKAYIAYLSQRVYYLGARLDTVTAGSVARRLECHLRAGAVMDEQGRLIYSSGSQTALAQSLNMGRATLYRAMEELAQQGLVQREGKEIVLKG